MPVRVLQGALDTLPYIYIYYIYMYKYILEWRLPIALTY